MVQWGEFTAKRAKPTELLAGQLMMSRVRWRAKRITLLRSFERNPLQAQTEQHHSTLLKRLDMKPRKLLIKSSTNRGK